MKKYIILITVILAVNCKAQTPIKSLFDDEYGKIPNAYYKDTNNDFDPYVGTWRYQSGTVIWEITFVKKVMYFQATNKPSIYEDLLVGAYKYTKDGVVLINTLGQLENQPPIVYNFNIYSYTIIGKDAIPVCQECSQNERRIALFFNDPTRNIEGLMGDLVLRHVIENGIHKIKAKLWQTGAALVGNGVEPAFHDFTMPFGDYTFVKVN